MDKPTEPGWYLCNCDGKSNYIKGDLVLFFNGQHLLTSPGGHRSLLPVTNFRLLIEKPAPEIIIGDGKTVLRPGVWATRWIANERFGSDWYAFANRCETESIKGREYTRIGDVPGEGE